MINVLPARSVIRNVKNVKETFLFHFLSSKDREKRSRKVGRSRGMISLREMMPLRVENTLCRINEALKEKKCLNVSSRALPCSLQQACQERFLLRRIHGYFLKCSLFKAQETLGATRVVQETHHNFNISTFGVSIFISANTWRGTSGAYTSPSRFGKARHQAASFGGNGRRHHFFQKFLKLICLYSGC